MDHLRVPLQTPRQSPRGTPVEGSEGNGSSSSSNWLVVHGSPFSPLSASTLAPRRNYGQELETRTMHLPPLDQMAIKKLEFPPLDSVDSRLSSPEDDGQEGRMPTFSLKRKRGDQDQDIVVVAPSSFKSLRQDRILFRPLVLPSDETY